MARFVITGNRRSAPGGPLAVISKHGNPAYTTDKAAVYRSLADVARELAYFRVNLPAYRWHAEQLPDGPLSTAILRAVPVDLPTSEPAS